MGPSKCTELQPSASSTKLQLAIRLPVAPHFPFVLGRLFLHRLQLSDWLGQVALDYSPPSPN
ncbi:hypothetical protein CGRA01v4_09189 [Colletotrichum graminicola]|nr:hypothetical protein CGRA01v4_09189 [Colletotrichum graminicola]